MLLEQDTAQLFGRREVELLARQLMGLCLQHPQALAELDRLVQAMETGQRLCLLLLDIDHFKKFNDSFGHHIGDQVLKLLASVLRESVKGQDTAVRYGGEEFAWLLPDCAISSAVQRIHQFQAELQRQPLRLSAHNTVLSASAADTDVDANSIGLTASFGVTQIQQAGDLDQAFKQADAALYQAKQSGRNRLEIA